MHKKLRIFCLNALLGCTLAACSSPGKQNPQDSEVNMDAFWEDADGAKTDKEEENGEQDPDSLKPILDADAADEELLALVKDDTNVVAQEDYAKVVRDIKEHVEKYSGQIYQMEGFYTKKDGISYITDIRDGEAGECLPLRYLAEEPEEGVLVKITGVISEEDSREAKETGAVLDVVVLEFPEK